MKLGRAFDPQACLWTSLCAAAVIMAPAASAADDAASPRFQFQRPNRDASAAATANGGAKFRSASSATMSKDGKARPKATGAAANDGNPLRAASGARIVPVAAETLVEANTEYAATDDAWPVADNQSLAKPIAFAPRPAAPRSSQQRAVRTAALPAAAQPANSGGGMSAVQRTRAIPAAAVEPWAGEAIFGVPVDQGAYCDACCEPECGIFEPACGLAEPACGLAEPGCALAEPGCAIVEPGCALVEPGCELQDPACGIAEPDCGIVGCGTCVGNPGPDFWCFPICLPRFKDLRFWGGVHGFKGPRDSPAFGGAGDGNFGFQEGVNIGGRAPLVSLLFPQLSYQLGYQAVQSQLSGLSDGATDDRSQQFVTAGLFRRVNSGLQFGVVWDMLRDDFQMEEDFHQLRYEISLKSPQGREVGFWGATHTNDKSVTGAAGTVTYQAVDQYCGFVRCHFRDGGALRFWGGGTNDSEGIFGGDFVAPLNARWSVLTGFNYLITDEPEGALGAQEESWNVGINLVWHYGLTAKKGQLNPHAPLFPTADNGWLFIDARP
jgi:hypothetical protein